MVFFAGLRYDQDFHYAGGGVTLGDGKRPIAWWKPKGSSTYRVLMGDLTFQNLPARKLPASSPSSDPATLRWPAPAERDNRRLAQIARVDSAAGEPARVSNPITEMALTVSASTRATGGGPAASGLMVARRHADGRIEDVTRCTPTGG
jgi:hypothetical protein